ncbi:MAG: HEPN domain-containing protein, partial [Vampirovibrionia bacterium]
MKKDTDNWLKIAKYDLRAAQVSFDGEMYLTCVEKCHNAVEKLLKGIITEHGKVP